MFRVTFSSHGERAFSALPPEVQHGVNEALRALAEDPLWFRHVRKLGGSEDRYRLRLGRWRILFWLRGNEIEVADIFLKKKPRRLPPWISMHALPSDFLQQCMRRGKTVCYFSIACLTAASARSWEGLMMSGSSLSLSKSSGTSVQPRMMPSTCCARRYATTS